MAISSAANSARQTIPSLLKEQPHLAQELSQTFWRDIGLHPQKISASTGIARFTRSRNQGSGRSDEKIILSGAYASVRQEIRATGTGRPEGRACRSKALSEAFY